MPGPDLAGFLAAQLRLRGWFGQDVVFYDAPEVTLPPGTPTDAFGRSLDPTIAGSAVAASAVVKCSVAFRALGEQGELSPAGWFEHTHVMLMTGSAAASAVEGKTTFTLRDGSYDIDAYKLDPGFQGVTRVLVYGRKRGDA